MNINLFQQQQANNSCTSIINFIPLDKIGQGSFSSVYKVRRITDDQIYALKKIKIAALKDKQRQNALNQIRILASLNSQYIVQYKQAFFDQKLNLLCIVMEYANEGDLQKKIQYFRKSMTHIPENEVWKAAYHTIRGLDILHTKSILHRDIKSANIFIANSVYKLGDMNVSKVQDSVQKLAYTQTGTPYYASPEVWRDEPYDYKSDIWSLGCVLYEMCTFRPPFKGKDLQTLFRNVQRGLYDPLPIQYSQQLSQFISFCLRLNPKQRLSSKQLLSSPALNKKCIQLFLEIDNSEYNEQLLKTIKLPSDLKDLKKKLPKSKYSCSIDNIQYKKDKNQIGLDEEEQVSSNKKYSYNDYYIKLANKKKQSQHLSSVKLMRVISQGSPTKNPEQYAGNNKLQKNYRLQQIQSEKRIQTSRINDLKIKSSVPRLEKMEIQLQLREKEIKNKQLKINLDKQKYYIALQDKNNQNKLRKMSHDQSEKSSRAVLNQIQLIKKLSQHDSVNKCLSQRQIQSNAQLINMIPNSPGTQRNLKQQKDGSHILLTKKSQQLIQIQRQVQQKRKQLKKIGSIQRLQRNPKSTNNISYRPSPSLILNPIKKSLDYIPNSLIKSPSSTEDQPSHSKIKQKRKLVLGQQIQKVSPTPYMMGLIDAPRMKRMLQNLNQVKKSRDIEIKSKILSTRYLHKY